MKDRQMFFLALVCVIANSLSGIYSILLAVALFIGMISCRDS